MPGSTYEELGAFIGKHTPYGTQRTLPQLVGDAETFDPYNEDRSAADQGTGNLHQEGNLKDPDDYVAICGWLAKFPRADGTTFSGRDANMTPADKDQCLHWRLGGTEYQITKAIRIPYTYIRAGDGKTVTASILIGYNGNGGD